MPRSRAGEEHTVITDYWCLLPLQVSAMLWDVWDPWTEGMSLAWGEVTCYRIFYWMEIPQYKLFNGMIFLHSFQGWYVLFCKIIPSVSMLIFQKLHRIKTESPVFKNITLKFSVLKRFNEGSSLGFMKYKMLKQTHFWYMHGICQICIFHRGKKKKSHWEVSCYLLAENY